MKLETYQLGHTHTVGVLLCAHVYVITYTYVCTFKRKLTVYSRKPKREKVERLWLRDIFKI